MLEYLELRKENDNEKIQGLSSMMLDTGGLFDSGIIPVSVELHYLRYQILCTYGTMQLPLEVVTCSFQNCSASKPVSSSPNHMTYLSPIISRPDCLWCDHAHVHEMAQQ